MSRRLPLLLAPLVALALAAAGCNGDAGDTDHTAAQPSQAAGHRPSPAPATATGEPGTDGEGSHGDAPGAGTEYCRLLGTDFDALFNDIQGPQDADKVVDLMRRVAGTAPPKVRDDWRVLGGTFDEIQHALSRAARLQKQAEDKSLSPQQLLRRAYRLMQRTQALNDPRSQAAGAAVARHARHYCGLDLLG
jgi:hypothetical protein